MKTYKIIFLFLAVTSLKDVIQANEIQLPHDESRDVVTMGSNKLASKALLEASVYGGVKEIKQALLDGADVNYRNEKSQTALYLVTKLSRYDLVKLLFDHDADVNIVGDDKISPLHWAVEYNNTRIVELLLKNGANVSAKDGLGEIPLHWAAWTGRVESAKLLLEYGSDPEAENNDGVTPVKLAVRQEHEEIIGLFESY